MLLRESLARCVWFGVVVATVGVAVLMLGKSGALDFSNWWFLHKDFRGYL